LLRRFRKKKSPGGSTKRIPINVRILRDQSGPGAAVSQGVSVAIFISSEVFEFEDSAIAGAAAGCAFAGAYFLDHMAQTQDRSASLHDAIKVMRLMDWPAPGSSPTAHSSRPVISQHNLDSITLRMRSCPVSAPCDPEILRQQKAHPAAAPAMAEFKPKHSDGNKIATEDSCETACSSPIGRPKCDVDGIRFVLPTGEFLFLNRPSNFACKINRQFAISSRKIVRPQQSQVIHLRLHGTRKCTFHIAKKSSLSIKVGPKTRNPPE